MNDDNEKLMGVHEAAKYLAKKWGMDSYSLEAFRMHRKRWNVHPSLSSENATFWRKSDLDKLPKPDKSRPRSPRKKENEDSDNPATSQCMLMNRTAYKAGVA